MTPVGAHIVLHKMVPTPGKQKIQAVLLYKRTQNAPVHPGYWGLFGGRLKNNEDPLKGLQREIAEEMEVTGMQQDWLKNAKHLTDLSIVRDEKELSVRYFEAPLDRDMDSLRLKRNKNKVEGEGLGWFTEEEIQHIWLRPEDRTALTKFFSSGARPTQGSKTG